MLSQPLGPATQLVKSGFGAVVVERAIISAGALIFGLYLFVVVESVLLSPQPGRADFIAFYDAARMAWAGDAPGAYDWSRLRLLQAETLGLQPDALTGFLGWVNPPTFLFFVLPFGLLPYGLAWFAWILATSVLFALAVRTAFPEIAAPASLLALSLPAVLVCMVLGQNGLLTAALLCWTFALLDRRPVLAGIALGLLTYKPQFGLLLPLLLAFTGRWRVFAAAAACSVALFLVSMLAFGSAAWVSFIGAVAHNDAIYLAQRHAALPRIQSVYAFVFEATEHRTLAWVVHWVFAACVAAVVIRLWLRRPEGPAGARNAAAMAAAFLMTPFAWIYDAPAVGIAALFLAAAGLRDGWLPWERWMLLTACLLPGLMLAGVFSPLVAPAAWLLILACAWRRDSAWRLNLAPSGSPSADT
jgi:hypothetical protein